MGFQAEPRNERQSGYVIGEGTACFILLAIQLLLRARRVLYCWQSSCCSGHGVFYIVGNPVVAQGTVCFILLAIQLLLRARRVLYCWQSSYVVDAVPLQGIGIRQYCAFSY